MARSKTDAGLLTLFAVEEKAPRSMMVIELGEIYSQCARAIVRSRLWDPAQPDDRAWSERACPTMW